MGRISLAQRCLDEYAHVNETGTWVIVYDFRGRKPSPRFWANLRRLKSQTGCRSIQYSVVLARSGRAASAAAKLASHYGVDVAVFKGEPVTPA
ncbi:hypothetical protein JXL21_13665 [Candidatus Bathyarchaeota archaeon]|nr:hypothetical protein [Candidatus Bathyarchaeota archaeon]